MTKKCTDKEQTPADQGEEILTPAWSNIVNLVQSLVTTGAFGARYPDPCPDGHGPIGTNEKDLAHAVQVEVPGLAWPLATTKKVYQGFWTETHPFAPETQQVLDFIKFCYRAVAKPIQDEFHKDRKHYHLSFDETAGKQALITDINRIFTRNKLVYVLTDTGQVVKKQPGMLASSLVPIQVLTGDPSLDGMLEDARLKFANPDPSVRITSVQLLWECWDRLKILENRDNEKQWSSILAKAAGSEAFLSILDVESKMLTEIGDTLHLRHFETTLPTITDPAQTDYLFNRLYTMIRFPLVKRSTSLP